MAPVTATVGDVEVQSSSGTVESLTESLAQTETAAAPTEAERQAAIDATAAKAETAAPASAKTEEPDPASEAGKQLAKRKQSLQDRIDQVTWEKHEAIREAERLKAEIAAAKQPAKSAADPARPTLKSFVDRIGTDFDDYESAVEAHADALTDYKLTAVQQASHAQQFTRARDEALHQTYTRGTSAHADFDAVLGQFVSEGGRLAPSNAAEAQGPLGDLEQVILGHPLGHSVAYEVAKDADLRGRLMGATSRVMFMAEMGKLLTRLEGAPTGSPPKVAPVSKAKPPVQPAKGQPQATGGPPGDDASDEEHLAYYNQQEAARRRRA